MILDTTFLIDVLRGAEDVNELVEEVDAEGAPFVSAVTVMELWEGIHISEVSDAERTAVEGLLTDIGEFSFDRECATVAGELTATLVAAGEPIDETDVMIAATGLVHGHPIVTRNVDHFERIDDLAVVSY